ncbi:MAG: chromate transporter [Clostridia bacterium]|nr:chromate transporter [Clostridia bacterium]
MDINLQKEIFLSFFRAGMLGFGGGPSSIPLVHNEVVKRNRWMDDDEFSDILAIGNSLPGPIITKMAGYIGYRIGGAVGLFNAVLACVIPTVLIMVILVGFLASKQDSPIIMGMTQAVTPVVGVMLFSLAYSFLSKAKSSLGWLVTIVIGLVSLFLYQFMNVHPAFVIGGLLAYGLLGGKVNLKNKKEKQK